jgi:hypothetical protein
MASQVRHRIGGSIGTVARVAFSNLVRDGAVAIDPEVAKVEFVNPSRRPDEPCSNRSLAAECPLGRRHPHHNVCAQLKNSARISRELFGEPPLLEASNGFNVSVLNHRRWFCSSRLV